MVNTNTSQSKLSHRFTSNHVFNILQQTSNILAASSITGCSVHFLFIFLFIYLDQTALAWLNTLSVLAWLSTLWFNRVKRHGISILIMNTEVLVHAIAATSLLGIDAGFQYYLWPMTLLLMVIPGLNITWSAILAFINIAVFAALCLIFHAGLDNLTAYYPALLIFNLMGASLPFITTAAVSRYAYSNQYLSLVNLAEKDELTQLFNRRFGLEALKHYINYQKINNVPLCISLVDVDYFKRVNDELGHSKGDEILIKIANYLSTSMRETDISSRWGGEEFLFIFPNVELHQIQQRIESICKDMPNHISVENWNHVISCSFGLIQVEKKETAESALKRVDRSLYQAKKNGRYQVVSGH